MAYVVGNPKTKKAFKELVANGELLSSGLYNPGLGGPIPHNGEVSVQGPHYPKPHTWYAVATIRDGVVVKVS